MLKDAFRLGTALLIALLLGAPGIGAQGPSPAALTVAPTAVTVGGKIEQDTTWLAVDSPYIVERDVTVEPGVTLTIQPGVVVKFSERWTNQVRLVVNGTLIAQGTAQVPIVFTSFKDDAHAGDTNRDGAATQPAPGNWGGIVVNPGSSGSVLRYTWIGYGGAYAVAAKYGACLNLLTNDVSVRDSVIAYSLKRGVYVEDASPTLEGNEIRDHANDGVRYVGFDATQAVALRNNVFLNNANWAVLALLTDETASVQLDGNTSTGSAGNGFGLQGTIAGAVAYGTDPAFPFIVNARTTVNPGASLTLRQGTLVKFGPAIGLHVDGTLLAQGTAQAPVVFTSIKDDARGGDANGDGAATQPAPGDWTALYLNAGSSANVLQHARVYYGGRGGYNQWGSINVYGDDLAIRDSVVGSSGDYGIYLQYTPGASGLGEASPSAARRLEIARSTISGSSRHGLYVNAGVIVSVLNNTFSGNGKAAIVRHTEATVLHRGNRATGNEVNGIAFSGVVARDTTLEPSADLPIVVDSRLNVNAGATLDIKPQRVELMPFQSIYVSGTLRAENVWFTRHQPGTYWGSLFFQPGSAGAFSNHCLLEYGSGDGMIYVENASPTIGDTLFRSACGPTSGIVVRGAQSSPVISGCQGLHNEYGIYVLTGASPIVRGSTLGGNNVGLYTLDSQPRINESLLVGNRACGVQNAKAGTCVDAERNLWGADGGPYDPSGAADTCGAGRSNLNEGADRVTDNVDYTPWLAPGDWRPSRPILTEPQCGHTNQPLQQLRGAAFSGATVEVYDNGLPITTTVASAGGYFEAVVSLSAGEHSLTAVASDGAVRTLPSKPLNLTVDTTLDADPLSILFTWGSGETRRAARVRDSRGCSAPCGQAAGGGVVELFPDTSTTLTVYVRGEPDSVALLYAGRVVTLTETEEGWYRGSLMPQDGDFCLQVMRGATVADSCVGTMRVLDGGYVYDRESAARLADATVTCYVRDEEAYAWALWPASLYDGQRNPQKTAANGRYLFSTPPGEYQLVVEAATYRTERRPAAYVEGQMLRETIGLVHDYPVYLPLLYRNY